MAGQDRLAPDSYGQMRLANTRRTEEQHRFGIGDKAPGREFADLLLIDRGLGREVETVEIAHKREARQSDTHLDPAFVSICGMGFAMDRSSLI